MAAQREDDLAVIVVQAAVREDLIDESNSKRSAVHWLVSTWPSHRSQFCRQMEARRQTLRIVLKNNKLFELFNLRAGGARGTSQRLWLEKLWVGARASGIAMTRSAAVPVQRCPKNVYWVGLWHGRKNNVLPYRRR